MNGKSINMYHFILLVRLILVTRFQIKNKTVGHVVESVVKALPELVSVQISHSFCLAVAPVNSQLHPEANHHSACFQCAENFYYHVIAAVAVLLAKSSL